MSEFIEYFINLGTSLTYAEWLFMKIDELRIYWAVIGRFIQTPRHDIGLHESSKIQYNSV